METKKVLTVIGLIIQSMFAIGQSNPDTQTPQNAVMGASSYFGKGTNIISAGVGIGGNYTYWGNGYAETPNIALAYDNGTFGNVGPGTISLGALFSYKGISYNYTDFHSGYYYDQKWTYWILGLRSAYHWDFFNSPKCDPYLGLMLGYYYLGYSASSSDPYFSIPGDRYYYLYSGNYNSYFAISMYLGFRYFVSNHVGLWAELGYGYSNLAAGVSFKL